MSHDAAPGTTNGRRAIGLEAIRYARETRRVEVEGFDGYFRVQEITYGDRTQATLMGLNGRNGKAGPKVEGDAPPDVMFVPRIVAMGWVNEDGSLVVDSPVGGAEQVAKLPSRAVSAMYDVIIEISGMKAEAREEAGKDLSGTPAASGG